MAGRPHRRLRPLLLEAMAYLSWGWVIPPGDVRGVPVTSSRPVLGANGADGGAVQAAGRAMTKRLLA